LTIVKMELQEGGRRHRGAPPVGCDETTRRDQRV
jgi:hypothetical protein